MEDTLYLGRGQPVSGNLPLVKRAVQLAHDLDRPILNVNEAAEALQLP